MLRKVSLVIVVVLTVLLLGATSLAQGPSPQHSEPRWQVSYWNNVSLTGPPAREETVANVNFYWGYGSPHHTVTGEGFSARFTRYIDVAAGTYRFIATSDDGIRVYVDGRLIINEWRDQSARTFTADVGLNAGHHLVTVEYYEMTGVAEVKVTFSAVSEQPDAWRGHYFDNRWLSGSPVLTRSDASIAFEWGYGSPSPGIAADNFSVRWTRTVAFPVGNYRFTATSDDGIRVYVDQRLIIDEWHDSHRRSYSADLNLAGGPHDIVVEYYENSGSATAKLEWTLLSEDIAQWRGEYFDNRWLRGSPVMTREDESIDFNWGYGSPSQRIPSDSFSVRWTRTVYLESGLYRFTATTDDGVQLWVNNHLLIDKWYEQPPTAHSGTIHVSGDVPIRMDYFEAGGTAQARLTWTRMGEVPPIPPQDEIIVDNLDAGFTKAGSPTAWRTAQDGYGGSMIWTRNNDQIRPRYNWARWRPSLQPGRYEVYVYIPVQQATTAQARYWVTHSGDYTLRVVSQWANRGNWVSLGQYYFTGLGDEYVSLADVTFEPYLSTSIAFDAVKWVAR